MTALVLGLGVLACGGAAPEEVPAEAAVPKPILVTELRLPVLTVERSFTHDAELRGLVTLAMELGLSDIPGVVPLVPGDGPPPAFAGSRPPAGRMADARLLARGSPEALELELEVCIAGEGCESTVATGTLKAPWDAIGTLLEGAAAALDVDVEEAVVTAWHKPGSKDSYSELITGRAAAAYYGLIPPSLTPGDRKADPVVKAVYLDPGQPLAQWMRARWEVASTMDGGKAAEALAKAQLLRPSSPLLLADQAALLGLTGHPNEALLIWETLAAAAPRDPRWWLPLARARLAGGHAEEAVATLESLPPAFSWDPGVAALRVSAAEAADPAADLDPLLARWQTVATTNPEPVRRRISARVRAQRYAEAEELMGALRERAPGPNTDALEVALFVALGRLDQAEELAPPGVASRIRARRQLAANPGLVPEGLLPEDPVAVLVAGEAALWRKAPAEALAAAEAGIVAAPQSAEAQMLRARALEGLGRAHQASEAWAKAWELDPGLSGGPMESGRIASTFTYVEAGEHPGAVDPTAAPGPQGPEL